ncbi:MAG: cold shock domain-containing protein [Deltaproteobacteria bacterium]|nr:cold shock domain-containing protein [Deltaproteobacteria bacterium]
MPQGIVQSFDQEKGHGIILTDDQEELPVHRSALAEESVSSLYPGDVVEFRVGKNRYGRRSALEVRRIGWDESHGDEDDEPKEWTF